MIKKEARPNEKSETKPVKTKTKISKKRAKPLRLDLDSGWELDIIVLISRVQF